MNEPGRTVACPFCASRYFLPAALMGSGGARIRCPNCERTFVVPSSEVEAADEAMQKSAPLEDAPSAMAEDHPASPPHVRDPEPSPAAPHDEAVGAPAEAPAPAERATRMLDMLAGRHGEALHAAAREGRLFAAYGPEILELFEAWRKDAGRDADSAIFREALRERWGVDLEPGGD